MPSSKFRDMWLSGKFAIDRKNKGTINERDEKEAIAALKELIPQQSKGCLFRPAKASWAGNRALA